MNSLTFWADKHIIARFGKIVIKALKSILGL